MAPIKFLRHISTSSSKQMTPVCLNLAKKSVYLNNRNGKKWVLLKN
jgi:hypothetical protein